MPRRPPRAPRAPVLRPSLEAFERTSPGAILGDLLTFDRLVTGPVIHLIYWAGLGLIALGGFAVVGSAVGMALNEPGWMGLALAAPMLVAGFLALAMGVLLWRSFCELYVVLFQIAADLRAMRRRAETDTAPEAPPPSEISPRF